MERRKNIQKTLRSLSLMITILADDKFLVCPHKIECSCCSQRCSSRNYILLFMTLSIQGYTDALAMGYPMCKAPEKNLASLGVPYSNSIIESSIGIKPSSVP